jgi:hypothetical protein
MKLPLYAAVVVGTALSLSCTTYVKPTSCTEGSTSCAGIHDARFCEYVAESTQGSDCAASHIGKDKPFCVVTNLRCTNTSYALKSGDCHVTEYRAVRDDDRDECGPNVPVFVSR